MPEQSAWNMKKTIAGRIVDQLAESTQEEQKALILKLLDQVKPEFLTALDFAYEMTPGQKRGSKNNA